MKKMFVLPVLCFSVIFFTVNPIFTQNAEEATTNQIDAPYECEEDLIEIMFDKDSQVRLRSGSLVDLKSNALVGVNQILNQLDWYKWFRICDVDEETIDSWSVKGERNTGKPVYNMNNIYRLQIPKDQDIWEICKSLERFAGIMSANPVPKPMEPPVPPNYQSNQGYLNSVSSTPTGIDAAYAWTQTGGTGTGVTVCDLEYSWNYSHADITQGVGSSLNSWTDPGYGTDHGTAVIGELVADNNSWGTTGICYGANLKTCGTYYGSPLSWNVSGAILLSVASLSAGDIILLEQQWDYNGSGGYVPIEWWTNTNTAQTYNSVYAAIVTAISNGIHVIEAGGNGEVNTNGLSWYGNSGAIIVGAGTATTTNDLQRITTSYSGYWGSTFGQRFDLQGWGENVITTGYGDYYSTEGTNYYYTNTFSGTSSASPIVAGALACAEGYYLANVSVTPPTPAYMRTHLKTYGTAQVTPPIGNIGPRPNLYAAINNFPPPAQTLDFGDLPDSYLTSLASNGARHLLGNYFLGSLIDAEGDGIPSANADSDDNTGIDDEDGVVFTNILSPGGTTNITVTASIGGGLLQCWIDYNNNGFFDIPSEEVFVNQPLVAGPNNLSFTTPASAVIGSTYARFRFSSSLYFGLIFYSYCADGEVEDYKVDIETNQGSSLKWEQLPDLSPTGMDVDATWQPNDIDNPPLLLADDFLCSETGNITDIHIWGSWLNDYLPFFEDPAAVQFTFSIHSDIPDPDGAGPEYSMPGQMLWMRTWTPTYNDVEEIVSGDEDWYNPFYPMWLDDNHQMCYKYNYILDPQDYFLQEGTAENPIVYWLDVQAEPLDQDPNCRFGWKTSISHWNDDAVWIDAMEQYNGFWNELRYPLGHEYETESIDLAFQITTEGGTTEEYDYGDAPDQPYPTLAASNGANHLLDGMTYLGFQVDSEPDGQPEPIALGDDNDIMYPPANDDEDGVTFISPLIQNQMAFVDIVASTNGLLNAWIDFDLNGSWAEAGEQIFFDFPLNPGINNLSFQVPATAIPAQSFARFRFDTNGGLNFDGFAPNGEVEDYEVFIDPGQSDEFDFGDAKDPSYPTLLANNGANHILDGITFLGASVDAEPDGQPHPNALGDDNNGIDDEDGVTINAAFSNMNPNGLIWYDVIASNAGILNVWIDWDVNGSWAEADNHAAIDIALAAGNNSVLIGIPATAVIGDTYVRFRFSSVAGLSYTGTAPDGEVEDYEITIEGDVDVNLKAYLEGPFNGSTMDTDLNSNNLIPLSQPYNADPTAKWYYTGTESVSSIPNVNVVDWVMVEFRDAPTAVAATGATIVSQQAAFLLNDGSIVGLDGVSPVITNGIFQYNLYVVIWHRNHLGIISAIPIVPTGINQFSYDFTTSLGQAYLNGQKHLGSGIYGMFGGDGHPDGTVINSDLVTIWSTLAGTPGYLMSDYNMDTQVDNKDKDDIWYPNNTSGTQVPN